MEQAAQVLSDAGWSPVLSKLSVVFWAAIDLVLAFAILIRRYAGLACWGMVGVSLFYLIAASVVVPSLWMDPLGPLTKVVPGLFLALVTRATLEPR